MPVSIEAITTAALSAALDASTRSHAATAANIANLHTEGYVPQRLVFDARLEDARTMLQERGALDGDAIEGIRGAVQPLVDAGGLPAKTQLDMHMADLARNAVHFQLLTQAVSRHLGMLALAAADGRK